MSEADGKCECNAYMAGECMCGAWDEPRPVSVGWFIRRTVKNPDAWRGKTIIPHNHVLYPRRDIAQGVIDENLPHFDSRFTYDVCEAWMHIDEAPNV